MSAVAFALETGENSDYVVSEEYMPFLLHDACEDVSAFGCEMSCCVAYHEAGDLL